MRDNNLHLKGIESCEEMNRINELFKKKRLEIDKKNETKITERLNDIMANMKHTENYEKTYRYIELEIEFLI